MRISALRYACLDQSFWLSSAFVPLFQIQIQPIALMLLLFIYFTRRNARKFLPKGCDITWSKLVQREKSV